MAAKKKTATKKTKTAPKKKTAKHVRKLAHTRNVRASRRKMRQTTLPGVNTEPNMIARTSGGLDKTFLVRFTNEEHAYVRKAAFEQHRSASSYIRDAALVAIGEMLLAKPTTSEAAKWKDDALTIQAAVL